MPGAKRSTPKSQNTEEKYVPRNTRGNVGSYARVGANRLSGSLQRNATPETASPDSTRSRQIHRHPRGIRAGGRFIEIGTSAGYSTLWLALACRATGRKITTYEILPEKAALARQTFDAAGVWDVVEFVHGDALDRLTGLKEIAFCFLDAEKEIYDRCYELLAPRLVPGGLLVADNAISHQADLQPALDRALADETVDALIVPIGKGELVCRKK